VTVTASASPQPTVTKTVTPSPSPSKKPSGDRHPPAIHLHSIKANKHHPAELVVTADDSNSGIARITRVHIRDGKWSLGRRSAKTFAPPRHKLRIVLRRSHRHHVATFHFWVIDKAGNIRAVTLRV
jgi:hypothetical protein